MMAGMKKRADRRRGRPPARGLLPGYALDIRRMRKQCGLTHRRMGLKLKVSGVTISLWENGLRRPSWSNFYALKRFALARGLKEFAVPFELELEKLARAAQAKWLLGFVERRAKSGDKYARHLLQASEGRVEDFAKRLAARQFNLLVEAGAGFLDIADPRYGMKLGYPLPRRIPAGDKRVWFMLTALEKEGTEVAVLRRARKLGKPDDDVLMGTVFLQTLRGLWNRAASLKPKAWARLQTVKPAIRGPIECPPQMMVRLPPEALTPEAIARFKRMAEAAEKEAAEKRSLGKGVKPIRLPRPVLSPEERLKRIREAEEAGSEPEPNEERKENQ